MTYVNLIEIVGEDDPKIIGLFDKVSEDIQDRGIVLGITFHQMMCNNCKSSEIV